jgi:predicted  nucleic acid-binding Zn-ribbon protein
MQRTTVAAAAAVLAMSVLSGCGDLNSSDVMGGTDDYCSAVQDLKDQFSALSGEDMTGERIDDLRSSLEDLEGKAPDSVADDYARLTDALDQLEETLGAVGLSISDLDDAAKLQQVQQEASPEEAQAIQEAAQSLGTDFEAAGQSIEREVKADCGIKLGE